MSTGNTIAAVIVTFNRAQKLAKVLDAVLAQTRLPDRIFVIDNASTDNTAEIVRQHGNDSVTYVPLAVNGGGAGGFNEGVRAAYQDGFDYLWLMDDDGYPAPSALEILHDSIREFTARYEWRPSFACSAVKWMDGSLCEMNTPSPVWDWPRFYTDDLPVFLVQSCSFVSVLIPSWAVRKHGLPVKDYFIWYDDAEYTQRIATSYPGLFCPRSLTMHDTPDNKGVNYGLVTAASLWKFRYGARNEASFKHETQGLWGFVSFLRRAHVEMRTGSVPARLRLKIYKAAFSGLRFRPKREMV